MSPQAAPPIRLLIIAHDAGMSGAERSLLEIIDRLDRNTFQPTVLAPLPGPFVDALRQRNVACHCGLVQRWIHYRKPQPRGKNDIRGRIRWLLLYPLLRSAIALLTLPVRLMVLATLARKLDINAIYSNTVTVIDGALLARLLRLRHVWHLREAVSGNRDLYWPFSTAWLPGFIKRHADSVIVNSHALRRELFGNDATASIQVIHNGIDLATASDENASPADNQHTSAHAPRTVIIGRLNPRKGIPVYLAALVPVIRKYPASRHLIVGDGSPDYVDWLRGEAERLGVSENVEFTGFLADVRPVLQHTNILVNASEMEPFGRTLLEAMAAGVPIIATRSGGPEEIIEDGRSGLLVPPGDSPTLAACMLQLLDAPKEAARLAQAGRQRVRDHFDVKQTTAAVIDLLRGT